jgi:YidC/Oxa1 family membrane protein insertase
VDAFFDALASLIAWFYELVPSYIFAISGLTVTVMLVLAPLTVKSTRSMLAMQRLQPEIKKLQQQHKGDRVALNEAMMAFYKEHQINPLGGCLPMLLQMPVFIIMYNVIAGLTNKKGPKYLDKESELFQSLAGKGGEMVEWGIHLERSASTQISESFGGAIPMIALAIIGVATSYFQTKRMSARNPQAAQANPQAQMMQRVFPLMFGVICWISPAGVVVYFVVSNLFRIAQQELMYKFDPVLAREVRKEVHEVEAKAVELKGKPTAPSRTAGSGGNSRAGGGGNSRGGASQRNRNKNKKKRRR